MLWSEGLQGYPLNDAKGELFLRLSPDPMPVFHNIYCRKVALRTGHHTNMEIDSITRGVIDTPLRTIKACDLRLVRRGLQPAACWQNVLHPERPLIICASTLRYLLNTLSPGPHPQWRHWSSSLVGQPGALPIDCLDVKLTG